MVRRVSAEQGNRDPKPFFGRGDLQILARPSQRRQPNAAFSTSFSTATNRSSCPSTNSVSGPVGAMSVNGDSYSRLADITPCSVQVVDDQIDEFDLR